MEFRIREYEDKDRAKVDRLAVSAFSRCRPLYAEWEDLREKVSRMSALARSSRLIVAEAGSNVVGAVAYVPPGNHSSGLFRPEWGLMRMLVVDPEARGNGIGRALAETCINLAKKDRAEALALHTSRIMTVARGMYARMGFSFYSHAPGINGAPYDIYIKKPV